MFSSLKNIYKDEKTFRAVIILFALFVFLFEFFSKMSAVISPFIIAIIISALIDKHVSNLQKIGVHRGVGAAIAVMFIVLCIISLIVVLSFFVQKYFAYYSENIHSAATFLAEWLPQKLNYWAEKLHLPIKVNTETIREYVVSSFGEISEALARSIVAIYEHAKSVVGIFSFVFFTPILVFYITKDWNKIIMKTREYTPDKFLAFLDFALPQAVQALKNQLRGQTKVAFIAFFIYTPCLFLIGIKPFILIGIISGILTFVPFVGMIVAFLLVFLVALGQSAGILQITLILALYLVGSSIESNFLTPKFVGKQVGMHPIWIFFAVLTVISWLGIYCAFFVMPIATLIWSLAQSTIKWFKDDEVRLATK
jgi:predicted PurR-regulated permease PerM